MATASGAIGGFSGGRSARPASTWPGLAASAVASAWIALGSIHRDQHSDSILNVLVSLQRWTPFVWEQDRFGMLVPLLTLPIRNPLANMIAQAALSTFAGLSTFFLLARYAFPDGRHRVAGALGAASFLALTPAYYRFEYLVDTSYGIGLSLTLAGLILVEPRPSGGSRGRWALALVLAGVAHWVNSATALFLGPFVLLRGLPDLWEGCRSSGSGSGPIGYRLARLARGLWRAESVRALALLAAGHTIGQGMMGFATDHPTDLSALPASEWPHAWGQLLRVSGKALDPPLWPWAMALEGLLGVVVLARLGFGRGGWSAIALVAGSAILWLLMGTRMWVKINDYEFRYLFPSALLFQTAAAGLAVAGPGAARSGREGAGFWSAIGPAVVLLVASAWSYGWPSPGGVRRDVDRKFGALTEDIIASGCTILAGDYWTVWVSVFHANLVLRERGDPRIVRGLTFRASPTYQLWKATPVDRRLAAVPIGDGLGETWLRSYQMPKLREVEVRRTIRVLRPDPPPNRR